MANSTQSKAVLELGNQLVAELGMEPSVDTLGRWMAHYIAELIHAVEAASPASRSTNLKECKRAILDLWKHRNDLPEGHRPFDDFAAISRAIESLDPTNNIPRHFRPLRQEADESEKSSKSKKWLKAADEIDRAARILIGHCLAQASYVAQDKTKKWVKLAGAAGVDAAELFVIRYVAVESKLTDEAKLLAAAEKKVVKDRLKHLEAFTKAAAMLKTDLDRRLKKPTKKQSPRCRRST